MLSGSLECVACKRELPPWLSNTASTRPCCPAGGAGSAAAEAQQTDNGAAAGIEGRGEGAAAAGSADAAAPAAAAAAAADAADVPPPPPRTASEPAPPPAAARPSSSGRPASAPAMLLKAKKPIVQVRTRTGETLQPGSSKRTKTGGWEGRGRECYEGRVRRAVGLLLWYQRAVAEPLLCGLPYWATNLHCCAAKTACRCSKAVPAHQPVKERLPSSRLWPSAIPLPPLSHPLPSAQSAALTPSLTWRQPLRPPYRPSRARLCRSTAGQGGRRLRPQIFLPSRAGAVPAGGLRKLCGL